MKKLYDQLWDKNASMAMAAIVERGDTPNPWEVARKAYELADCMAQVREELIKEGDDSLQHLLNEEPAWSGADTISLRNTETISLEK